MTRIHSAVLALAGLTVSLAGVPAQAPLNLDVIGGSMPGPLAFDLYPGNFPFDLCIILTGVTPGPTPIALFDPGDPRSVNVGTQILGNSFLGFFGLDLHFRVGPTTVPVLPGMVDTAFFFQGVTLPGTVRLVDRISVPRVVRLANAAAFRDRLVGFQDDRAFATVLPRTDGSWMLVGGGRGGLLSQTAHRTTEIYDPLTDTFSYGTPITTERSLHTQTRLQDGRWLLCGGVDRVNDPQAACEIYDPATDSFTAVAPMLFPRMGHTANLLPDGRVFVAGGLVALTTTPTPLSAIGDTTNTTEIYNPATNSWTQGPNLRTPRAGHIAIVRPDNRIALCGGISWDNILGVRWPAVRSSTDLYAPATNTIAAGPGMGNPRAMIEAVPLGNDRWLLAGGIDSLTLTNLGTPTASAEVYNAATNTFGSAGTMARARGIHKGWSLGGTRVLIAGGADGTVLSPNAIATTEIYDSASNSWSAGPSMTIPRTAFALFATPTGQMHLCGGGSSLGAISNGTEWYYF